MKKILFATSEAHPLAKTGGLGEVGGALPIALQKLGLDVRLVLPGYRSLLSQCREVRSLAQLNVIGSFEPVHILETMLSPSRVPVYIVDAPGLFDRPGSLYAGPDGQDYADNANRFAVFCRAATEIAMDRAHLYWRPDVVHCHDWQTGVIPALLRSESQSPASVFTIHNLAYSGSFERARFETLQLPSDLYQPESMEFFGQFAFVKGGLVYADQLTTVSPTYAREIQTPQQGFGLDGLIRRRATELIGIVNGVDYAQWDPANDDYIHAQFDVSTLENKARNKQALQQDMGLEPNPNALLMGVVSRLAHQKGMDLLPSALAPLWRHGAQLALLGSGEHEIQRCLQEMAQPNARSCAVRFGYDDPLSHRIIAGCDVVLMPSRFEPCGLTQLYGQRYGTVPVVRLTGGLTDTVVPVNAESLEARTATGIAFEGDDAEALTAAISAADRLFGSPHHWRQVQIAGMQRDFSWERSARAYAELYNRVATVRR